MSLHLWDCVHCEFISQWGGIGWMGFWGVEKALNNIAYIILDPMTRWQQGLQKKNRFNKQNNNFPCASHLSVHFFAIFARHIVKMPNVEFYGGRKQAMTSLDMVPRNSTPIWFAYI